MSQTKFVATGLILYLAIFIEMAITSSAIVEPQFSDPKQRAEYERVQKVIKKGPWLSKANDALLAATDLPDYLVTITGAKGKKQFRATRRSDKATLAIYVSATPNVEVRDMVCTTGISGSVIGPAPKGSPSGKPLGERSWQSWGSEPNSKMKTPTYFLQVQDGPAIIRIDLRAHIGQNKKGAAVWQPITQTDRLEMERIARLMLHKLAALKLTKATYRG